MLQSQDHCGAEIHDAVKLIGRLGSSAFRLSTTTVSMSLTGSCFSSESAPRRFHRGIRRRGGTIFAAALPSDERQDDELLAKYPPDNEQWFDQLGQVGEVLDQLLDAGLERHLPDYSDLEAEVA